MPYFYASIVFTLGTLASAYFVARYLTRQSGPPEDIGDIFMAGLLSLCCGFILLMFCNLLYIAPVGMLCTVALLSGILYFIRLGVTQESKKGDL